MFVAFCLASGCYGFWDPVQSAIWEIDCLQKSCLGDNKIATPAKLRENNLCFIMWKKLQYLDNDKWKQLIFKDEIFTIESRNDETSLKVKTYFFFMFPKQILSPSQTVIEPKHLALIVL